MAAVVLIASSAPSRARAGQDDNAWPEWTQPALIILVLGALSAIGFWLVRQDSVKRTAKSAADAVAAEAARQGRWDYLCRRFGPENAHRIWQKVIWQGQTREMLEEALGPPADLDEEVMKTKTRLTLKWGRLGGNRFTTRVILENGVVVGWKI